MSALVLLIGFLILSIGIIALMSPASVRPLVHRAIDERWVYPISGIRVFMGGILVLAASATRMPGFILAIGVFLILAGVSGPLMGEERIGRLAEWWCSQSNMVISVWGAVTASLGAVIMLASLG